MRNIAVFMMLVAPLAGASAAVRHLQFLRSVPADKAVLAKAPTEVRLYFSEKPLIEKTKIALADSAGHEVAVAKAEQATTDSTPVVAKVTGAMSRGSYVVKWESASQDGHTAKGTFRFRVR